VVTTDKVEGPFIITVLPSSGPYYTVFVDKCQSP
jgi:hypothetical protein